MAHMVNDLNFWRGRRVFITGHTGFKGSWLSCILADLGAEVTGFALPPQGDALYPQCGVDGRIHSVLGDIRNAEQLSTAFSAACPEVVIHMAAQPLVKAGYSDPVCTYETNVMGTLHLLECVRTSGQVRSFLNVTTDKVYQNNEWPWGYRENDRLDGYDPYSNSKSCSELVTHCYQRSFFQQNAPAISTARAGNVIGGGDYAQNRIIPDCVRAAQVGTPIVVRNPDSIRPYQHVLEPLFAYLAIASKQCEDPTFAGSYNVGPNEEGVVTTGRLVELFCMAWGGGQKWEHRPDGGPHEAGILKLDCSLIKNRLGWRPRWSIATAVEKTVDFAKQQQAQKPVGEIIAQQVQAYLSI